MIWPIGLGYFKYRFQTNDKWFFVQRAVSCVSKFYISFPLVNDKNPACEVCLPVSHSRKIWQISAGRSLNVFNDSSYLAFFYSTMFVWSPPFNVEYKIQTENVCNYTGLDMRCLWSGTLLFFINVTGGVCLARNNKTSIKPCNPRIFIIVTS